MPVARLDLPVALARGGVVADVALPAGHHPGRTPAVILAHGAGSDRRHPILLALQQAIRDAGWVGVLFDFPYREAGRRAPDPRPVLEGCWRAVLDAVRSDPRLAAPRIAAGGRSMGGRIACHVAAGGAAVDGLCFLGFPLHPAGRPAIERAAPLARVQAPMLFVQGTRDALADPALLARVVRPLGSVSIHWLEDADHGFHVPRRSGRSDAEVRDEAIATVIAWLAKLLD